MIVGAVQEAVGLDEILGAQGTCTTATGISQRQSGRCAVERRCREVWISQGPHLKIESFTTTVIVVSIDVAVGRKGEERGSRRHGVASTPMSAM